MMQIKRLPCGSYAANAYLVFDEHRDDCFLVDAGDDLNGIRKMIAESGKTPAAILLTHAHFDHTLAAQPLSEEWHIPVYLHEQDVEMLCDDDKNAHSLAPDTQLPTPHDLVPVPYGDTLSLCGADLRILHTPGHTKGSVCLYSPKDKIMFTGDTLFAEGFGRMDLYGGSMRAMLDSLKKLFAMPEDILVYSGHGDVSTIGRIRRRYA